jgi:hypothetical protein
VGTNATDGEKEKRAEKEREFLRLSAWLTG